jgi:hypothetical protein
VSFGGALIAIGALYLWLTEFPLRHGDAWAWWLLLASGVFGFGSFLAYLGYGYLDTWHGVATLALLPCFLLGLMRSFTRLTGPVDPRCLLRRALLLASSLGLVAGGATIMIVGMTTVFVPQDLAYMGLSANDLQAINPKLVPLIAHDRAGFGGGVLTCGVLLFFCIWCGRPSRSLWQVLCVAGIAGFATAIGVHPVVGYTDPVHLAPAVLGAITYCTGLVLTYRPMVHGDPSAQPEQSVVNLSPSDK